jgi:maltooligosyltrehalose trehalohydrolase
MQKRRLSLGAELVEGGAHFRVFAPKRGQVAVVFDGKDRTVALERDAEGFFAGFVPEVHAGARYKLKLDGERAFPDPVSRFQPDGPHGWSEIIDPSRFRWTDADWKGCKLQGQVVYELHIGTFTKEGTYAAAAEQLGELKRLGITLIEMMPVAEFPGRFGWGYDGVNLFAPTRLYGTPDDFRRFVDEAHGLGLGVVLDVVYNPFGPSGNYTAEFSDHYVHRERANEWGDALDFETETGARELFAANGAYWVDEFHFDGLRLDATQCIQDASEEHVVAEIVRRARAAAGKRSILVFAENERQEARFARPPERGGYGVDSMWNDDFHHSARVAATGRAEAYYSSTRGTAQELISALKWGYLFQGQYYPWQKNPRGHVALDLAGPALTLFLQNHDQVSNTIEGRRIHQLTSPGVHRALTALYLLAPATPLIFMGQEFAASSPFLFFADHEPDLAKLVEKGRREFIRQFPSANHPAVLERMAAPHDEVTFERCKLDFRERETHAETYALFTDLLRLRREDPAFSDQDRDTLYGTVVDDTAFVVRFATGTGHDRLLAVSLRTSFDAGVLADPLVAPLEGKSWRVVFTTDEPKYGGLGRAPVTGDGHIPILGGSAVVLAPEP